MTILIIHIIVSYDQNISLIIFMWKMNPMSGWNIRLVFTLPPRDSTLQYKRCVHFENNFPGITSLPLSGPLLGPLPCTVPRQHLSYAVFLLFATTTQLQFPTQQGSVIVLFHVVLQHIYISRFRYSTLSCSTPTYLYIKVPL